MTDHLHDPIPIGAQAVRDYYLPVLCARETAICGPHTFPIYGHVKALPNFLLFFRLIGERGLASAFHSFDGCYVNRPKRMGNGLSMHAYGAAVDINASTNPQGGAGDMPAAIVAIAYECGLTWGGIFNGPYIDKMHFQKGVEFTSLAGLEASGRHVPKVTYAAPKIVPIVPSKPAAVPVKVFDMKTHTPMTPATATMEQGTLIVRVG